MCYRLYEQLCWFNIQLILRYLQYLFPLQTLTQDWSNTRRAHLTKPKHPRTFSWSLSDPLWHPVNRRHHKQFLLTESNPTPLNMCSYSPILRQHCAHPNHLTGKLHLNLFVPLSCPTSYCSFDRQTPSGSPDPDLHQATLCRINQYLRATLDFTRFRRFHDDTGAHPAPQRFSFRLNHRRQKLLLHGRLTSCRTR